MLRMNRNGFTTLEVLASVAVVSCLAMIAAPIYNIFVAKAQIAEAISTINSEKIHITQNLKKGICALSDPSNEAKVRYGTIKVTGSYSAKPGSSCDTGCNLIFTFGTGASKQISGKNIVVNLHHNGKTSIDASSTVPSKLLPESLNQTTGNLTGESCSNLSFTNPSQTSGIGGSTDIDTGVAAPTPTAPPSGSGTDTENPPSGSGGSTPPPSGSGGSNPTPPSLTPQQEAQEAKLQIQSYTGELNFNDPISYLATWVGYLTLKPTATDEQRNFDNWTIEVMPTLNIYDGYTKGSAKPNQWGSRMRFVGSGYPAYTNSGWDGMPFYLPLTLKYKGIAVMVISPANSQSTQTWG